MFAIVNAPALARARWVVPVDALLRSVQTFQASGSGWASNQSIVDSQQ